MKELILAGAIETAAIEPTARHRREEPALRIELPRRREPLDLDSDPFHYVVDSRGEIRPATHPPHSRRAPSHRWSRAR